MNKDELKIIAEFDACPVCGSTDRFAGGVAEKQREKGLVGKGLKFGIYQMAGPIIDPNKITQVLVGTKVPTVSALLDVCMKCGCLYAVRLERGEATLRGTLAPPPPGQSPGPMLPGLRG